MLYFIIVLYLEISEIHASFILVRLNPFVIGTDSRTYPGPFVVVDISRKSEVRNSPLNSQSSRHSSEILIFFFDCL